MCLWVSIKAYTSANFKEETMLVECLLPILTCSDHIMKV